MELSCHYQQECQLEQVWLEIAGDLYGSSFELSGFDLMGKQEESTPRVGSSQRRRPAEKKSGQHPAQSDSVARSNPNKIKSDESQLLKREGKNLSDSLHKDRRLSQRKRSSNVPRSGKCPCQSTHGDDHFYRPSPGPRDLGTTSRVYNAHGTDSELADVCSSLPVMATRAIKHCVEGNLKSTEDNAPAGFKILSHQKSEHLEPDEQMQPTDQGVIKILIV